MYDVCIVGSGFAGTFLGLRLAQAGINTIIVEAGHNDPSGSDGRVELFPYRFHGDAAFPVDENRSIAAGGTSLKWNGVVSRLLETDFRSQSAFGLFDDWPISYDDLCLYYDAAEDVLCTQGAAYAPGCEPRRSKPYAVTWTSQEQCELGLPPLDGYGFYPLAFSRRDGAPVRLSEDELPRFAASRHATVLTDRPITRLLTEATSVSHAEAQVMDGPVETIEARYFVLASGVLETIRLLLTSTSITFVHGIGNEAGLVGRYVNAHPRYRVHIPREALKTRASSVYRTYKYADLLRQEGCAAACLDLNFFEPNPAVDFTVEMEPAAQNRVQLDWGRRDRWGRPLAILESRRTPTDRRTLQRVRQLRHQLTETLYAGSREPLIEGLTWFHPAGGCRMGHDASTGVVDRDCRVFGTSNLYVSGAAVFTTSGAGNPTLTVVALAMRLADHLIARLKRS